LTEKDTILLPPNLPFGKANHIAAANNANQILTNSPTQLSDTSRQ
jgi:hypothetical protein